MGPGDAIAKYLELSLGALSGDVNTPAAVARWRARNPKACNDAVLWLFRQLRANGLTDENWNDFADMVTARSPLLTYAMLESAFEEWSRATRKTALFPNGRQAEQEQENLDDLSDAQISERFVQARRAAARARAAK